MSFDNTHQKWLAAICIRHKRYHLGRYESLKEAALARKRAEQDNVPA